MKNVCYNLEKTKGGRRTVVRVEVLSSNSLRPLVAVEDGHCFGVFRFLLLLLFFVSTLSKNPPNIFVWNESFNSLKTRLYCGLQSLKKIDWKWKKVSFTAKEIYLIPHCRFFLSLILKNKNKIKFLCYFHFLVEKKNNFLNHSEIKHCVISSHATCNTHITGEESRDLEKYCGIYAENKWMVV